MKKLFVVSAFFVLLSPLAVSADAIADLRMQLQSVLTRIAELEAELTLVESGVTPTEGGSLCVTIDRDLNLGMENAEVKKLQQFLAQDPAVYPEGITSGYYGSLTQKAVQRWQSRNGVVSHGAPSTTGYGVVGPKTRTAIAASCGKTNTYAGANVVTMAFDTRSASAPASAELTLTLLEPACLSYALYWGDGSAPTTREATRTSGCGGVETQTLTHRYTQPGNYEATLYVAKGNAYSIPDTVTVSAPITVLGGEPFVRIIAPNGGESLRLGDTATIAWEVANYPEDSAVVFYVVAPDGTYRFAKRSHNTNAFDWIVGDRVCDGNSCNVQLDEGSGYRLRAALYTPAHACIDGCGAESVQPRFLATDQTDKTFAIENIGYQGNSPLSINEKSGMAPFTASMEVEIEPINSGVANFEVDFGDGSSAYRIHVPAGEERATVKDLSHTYAQAGKYTVRLRPVGAVQHIAEETITVDETELTVTPDDEVFVPVTVQATFETDSACSYDDEVERIYTLDWGDDSETSRYEVTVPRCGSGGSPDQDLETRTFTHDYARPGSYNVKLRIDAGDAYTSVVKRVDFEKAPLDLSPTFGFKPLAVTATFETDDSCTVDDDATVTYTLNWGDGSEEMEYTNTPGECDDDFTLNINERSYVYTYNEIGNYTVTLTAEKSNINDTYETTKKVVVDTSALRNGLRALARNLETEAIVRQLGAAVTSLFER